MFFWYFIDIISNKVIFFQNFDIFAFVKLGLGLGMIQDNYIKVYQMF